MHADCWSLFYEVNWNVSADRSIILRNLKSRQKDTTGHSFLEGSLHKWSLDPQISGQLHSTYPVQCACYLACSCVARRLTLARTNIYRPFQWTFLYSISCLLYSMLPTRTLYHLRTLFSLPTEIVISAWTVAHDWCQSALGAIENLKECSYLKCSYLKMGSHGNALAVSFYMRRALLHSRANYFHFSIEKRCGKLGRFVSFNEIHVL